MTGGVGWYVYAVSGRAHVSIKRTQGRGAEVQASRTQGRGETCISRIARAKHTHTYNGFLGRGCE